MKDMTRRLAATKERFRTCSAGHRRIEIEIEIDWFHATRKEHPIDFDFDRHSCAACEELRRKWHEGTELPPIHAFMVSHVEMRTSRRSV